MPNVTPTAVRTNAVRISTRLPNSVERALADALSLDGTDVPWTPEGRDLPTATDLRQSIDILTTQPADQKHMAWCLAKLQIAFESHMPRPTNEQAKNRAEVWADANADLGNDLWSEATLHCLQNAKYGMPKPPDFRRAVIDKLTKRQQKLDRCRRMMELHGERFENGKRVDTRAPEPLEVRLRAMIASLRKFGKHHRAIPHEKELAALEGRTPEDWIHEYGADGGAGYEKAPEVVLPKLSAETQAATFHAVAAKQRAKGNVRYAEHLERQAEALVPSVHVDEPMGDQHEAVA